MMVGVRRVTLATALVSMVLLAGCASSTTSSNGVTATPTFSPGGGTYTTSQAVTIGRTASWNSTPISFCSIAERNSKAT